MTSKMRQTGFLGRALQVLAVAVFAAGASMTAGAAGPHGGGGGGGGGGHFGGGGGGHFSGGGGGGAHFGGGGHFSGGGGAHFSGGARFGGFSGGHAVVGGAHFQPRAGFAAHGYSPGGTRFYPGNAAYGGGWHGGGWRGGGWHGGGWHGGYNGRPGWHGGVGGYGRYWGGGYWGGRFWPGVHYGVGFAWFLPVLPIGYATYWWSGVPYYYYDNAYYLWDSSYNGYVATDPPPIAGSDDTQAPSATENGVVSNDAVAAGSGGAGDIYVYPRNGQSDEQTSNDRFECHKWAVAQTGFDPTRSGNTQGTGADYRRAIGACLDARGYTVK